MASDFSLWTTEPLPTVARAFYSDLWGHAVEHYGMEVLFTDFLAYRGPALGTCHDCQKGLPECEDA